MTAPEPNAFTGGALDRVPERRLDEAWLAAQREHPEARAVIVGPGGVHVTGGDEPRLGLVPLADVAGDALLLGLDGRGPVFAVDAAGSPLPLRGLRDAAATLPREDIGLAAHAAALLNWHRRHGFCSACGAPTDVAGGGILRRCPACGTEHHPRTDPVVIMLVTDGDRVLLGRQAGWPSGRYSALAGFVEPGESLEEAVAREVSEETGVAVGPPRYVSSQPWPFPSSLMLGFTAPYRGGEPAARDGELEDARWFTREEIAAATRGEGPLGLPPRLAIARRLLEAWLGAETLSNP
jgi:NAD+ diphosphatase